MCRQHFSLNDFEDGMQAKFTSTAPRKLIKESLSNIAFFYPNLPILTKKCGNEDPS
jgi:hypothetical protein